MWHAVDDQRWNAARRIEPQVLRAALRTGIDIHEHGLERHTGFD